MNIKMNGRRLYLRFRLAGCLSLLALISGHWSSLANAQATTAQMRGKVADQTGAVIPNATIDVRNTGTGLDRKVISSSTGEYVIPSLAIGTYELKAVAQGFKTYTQTGIVLESGQDARVDVNLQIGSTNETVQVSAEAVQVDTSSASIRTEVDSTQVQELPLNTRNTLQLMTLVPGVGNASVGDGPTGGGGGAATSSLPTVVTNQRSGPLLNVNGSRVNGSEISLDGAILVTALYNIPSNLPNPDSIGEFSLLTSNYSAEYGHASGGAFVAVSKSGTNVFHGTAWEFLRNDALNARNWFAPAPAAKPILKQNQFGVAVGGPILKDKAFFYGTYEGLRIHQVALQNLASLTPAESTGDFSAISTQLTDPSTGLPYKNNQIPQSEWDPLSVGFMKYYLPIANAATGLFSSQTPNPISGDQFTVRGDYRTTRHDQTYVRYFHMKVSNVAAPLYTSYLNKFSYVDASEPNWGVTVRDTHTFTDHLIGDFGYSNTNITTNNEVQGQSISPTAMGGTYPIDGSTTTSPWVTISGAGTFTSGYPWYENSALKQVDAKLSWVKGRHLWQFGFLGFHEAEYLNAYLSTAGSARFTGTFTGNSFADYLIGRPTTFSQESVFTNSETTMTYGLYVQDDFKLSTRLTLNLGLRYDLMPPWQEAGQKSTTVNFNSSFRSTRFPNAAPGLAFPGDPGIPAGLMFADKTDFAPRLGFAYDVFGDGKTAIRGGYGIFYNPPGAITLSNTIEAPPFMALVSFAPQSFSNPYGTKYTDPFPFTFNPSNPYFAYPTSGWSPDAHIKNAFVQQFNINIQREFPKDLMVQVGYVGSLGNRLWYGHEANAAPYVPGETPQNEAQLAQSYRPFENQYFAGITGTSDIGYSNYNSLQVTARKRFSAGFQMQMAYTFSKSLDAGSFADSDGGTYQNPNNLLTGEYARSDFNQTQLFRLNGVWNLPQFNNLGLLRYGVGGWEVSGIVNYSSGTPFSLTTGAPAAWLGSSKTIGSLRLNQVGSACAGCGNRTQWTTGTGYFNPAAYVTPSNGTFGNSGRNSLVGPAYFDTDASVVKNFPFLSRESSKIQFRADFFNLFNNVPLNNPTTANSSPVFGKITSAGAARQVQLALRLVF